MTYGNANPNTGPRLAIQIDEDVEELLWNLQYALDGGLWRLYVEEPLQEYFRNRFAQRFLREGDDATGPWAPANPTAGHRKREEGYIPRINQRTGEMRDFFTEGTITSHSSSDGEFELEYPAEDPGELYMRIAIAQTGALGPGSRRVPERPVVAFDDMDTEAVSLIAQDALERFMRKK